jgi:hypothetical protein
MLLTKWCLDESQEESMDVVDENRDKCSNIVKTSQMTNSLDYDQYEDIPELSVVEDFSSVYDNDVQSATAQDAGL